MVFGEFDTEFLPAVVAVQDFMVWYPVCRSGSIFYQTYGGSEGGGGKRKREKKIICEHEHVKNVLQWKYPLQVIPLPLRGRRPTDRMLQCNG